MGKEDREPRAVLVSVCGLNLVTSHKCVMQCVFVGGRGGGGGRMGVCAHVWRSEVISESSFSLTM